MPLVIDDLREILLKSPKFRRWKPRQGKPSRPFGLGESFNHTGPSFRNLGETSRNSSEPASFKSIVDEPHYSPAKLAKSWGVSVETIRSLFRDEPGVLKIVRPATRTKRGYVTLRIPQSVAERVHRRMAA